MKFEKLEILDLHDNKIMDIKVLEKVNFKKLKELDLSNNKIFDINILEHTRFPKFEILNLSGNKIDKTSSILLNMLTNIENIYI